MTDLEFMDRAEAVLRAVEAGCDRINDEGLTDVDNQRVGGMVTITFEDRSQIVVNLQKPLHEIWLAAKSGGFHYRFDTDLDCWTDSRFGGEFFADMSRLATQQAGVNLVFSS